MRLLRNGAAHCARSACCREARAALGSAARNAAWVARWSPVGRALLQEAFGVEEPRVRASVVAQQYAYPLCATDRGLAFVQHGHADGPKGILCVEDAPCDAFSPDRELKVTHARPTERFVYLAASKGSLLAFVTFTPTWPGDEV